jgi:hypothetical protein
MKIIKIKRIKIINKNLKIINFLSRKSKKPEHKAIFLKIIIYTFNNKIKNLMK